MHHFLGIKGSTGVYFRAKLSLIHVVYIRVKRFYMYLGVVRFYDFIYSILIWAWRRWVEDEMVIARGGNLIRQASTHQWELQFVATTSNVMCEFEFYAVTLMFQIIVGLAWKNLYGLVQWPWKNNTPSIPK